MKLATLFENGDFVITGEVGPIKGAIHRDKTIEPVYQLTCLDRNRLALRSDLLTAYSLGTDNVLLLTGDHIQLGDNKEAKPVFDLDSVQLIKRPED